TFMSPRLICVLLLYLQLSECLPQADSQNHPLPNRRETGLLYHRNYSTKEYNAAFQNWGGLQDQHGVLFFANNDGVLSYDGKRWSLIKTPAESNIRSMAINKQGKIFVGALDDLGYLDQEKNGNHIYVSLLEKIKPELHGMGNVWQTLEHDGLVYFECETGLFVWNGERFQFFPWPNPNTYHITFVWKGSLFMQEEGLGLTVLNGDQFQLAPGGESFKNLRIYNALPAKNKVQLATRYEGLFFYDGNKVTKFETQADSFFEKNQIYCGLLLPDSSTIYGTRLGGAVIIDRKGSIQYLINNQNGLPTNITLGLTLDDEGNIWFSLDNGISKFEINNSISYYNANNGPEGAINSFCRYDGKLFVTTNTGLYVLRTNPLPGHPGSFEKIPGINMSSWQLMNFEDRMLVTSSQGFFEMVGNDLRKISDYASFSIHRYKGDSNRIVVSIGNQLQSLKFIDGRWREAGFIEGVNLDNISFTETQPGKVWLCTFSQGAALLSFPTEKGSVNYDQPSIKFLDQKDGLPGGSVRVNVIGGNEIFQSTADERIFRFDYGENLFKQDPEFISSLGLTENNLFPISDEDSSGSFFFRTKPVAGARQELILVQRSGTSVTHKRFDISRITEHVHVNTFEEGSVMWFGGADGVVRYEMKESDDSTPGFKTYLNRVLLNSDSVFFQGIGNVRQSLTFPYKSNAFRFEFTSTNYKAEDLNEFQYKLEGHDENWSEWTTENVKEYSRLWEGQYKFLVRSRNYAQVVGTTDEFNFVVAPPWFRSLYAYGIYIMACGVLVWGLVRWRSRNLLREKEALQKEIARQTQEIRHQNIQLAEQSEELKINAEQLRALDAMKSNFFVNISHEFRTPLSLILSPLEKYIQEKESGLIRMTDLERMHRNAKRLQQLINQLLDLAKLESGGMKLTLQESDFVYFIRVLTSSFESVAESRNIQFDVVIARDSYKTRFDQEKAEAIFYNLLSNAFKFTPDGGTINVKVAFPEDDTALPVSVEIADTGPGIPAAELDKIFDRFYQVDSSSAREFEGSGIGLSLVKELIQLMNGRVNVQSAVAMGTTFTVQLPFEPTEPAGDVANNILPTEIEKRIVLGNEAVAYTSLPNFVDPEQALILLVEDNADLRAYLTENLAGTYRIEVAENGVSGLEKALDLIPDLILSDMMMPQMDGFTFCTKVRQDERISHIPFVLLTARNTIESKLEGLELGADEYMTKPFNMKEIQVRIKNLLEQRKKLRKGFSREVVIQPKNISITSLDEKFLQRVLEIVEAHIGDPQFSVERFAEEIGMSRKNLLRKIQALTDQSVNEFVRNFRLQRAAQLIAGKTASISEIAYQVGFNNLSYFSKCFKDLFGVLPNEYEKVQGSKFEVQS
ncbi:MAG TPA: ATP-binding protein, partial [Chryseolinea sp.]